MRNDRSTHRGAWLFIAAAVLLLGGRAVHAAPPTIAEIDSMEAELEQHGLNGFATAAASNRWQAPVIPSEWYVAHGSPRGELAYYRAARRLGSTLLSAIDSWAPSLRSDAPDEALARATVLIDLAYWLGGSEGYGNLILAQRALDVATVGLARRVAPISKHRSPKL